MTPRTLALVAPLLALSGFGPCSRVALDQANPDEDGSDGTPDAGAPVGSAVDGGGAEAPAPPGSQCYFTSYPVGSKHCLLAPCYMVESVAEQPTCSGSDGHGTFTGYRDGDSIYATRGVHETSIVYRDAGTTFPDCVAGPGPGLDELPTGSGAYYATGLAYDSASAPDVATVCDDVSGSGTSFGVVEPTASSDQCYFTSYPVGSKECVTAPCRLTDVMEGPLVEDMICTAGSSNSSRVYLAGQTLYATSITGDVQELIAPGTPWFDYCMNVVSEPGLSLPTETGDYYATGLVVGSASPGDLAPFCQ